MNADSQIEVIFSMSKSLKQDYKKVLKTQKTCLDFDGPYNGKGRGSTVYANMEKAQKCYFDNLENLKILIKEL